MRSRKIDTLEASGIQGYRGLSAALELGGPAGGATALAPRLRVTPICFPEYRRRSRHDGVLWT